jgi:acetoin utilization deacetylase AcuC-like enzyme
MRASYTPDYYVPLPENHAFPMGKFPALYQILINEGLLRPDDVAVPESASWNDLEMVHTTQYLEKLRNGTLERAEERRMGLPWSAALVSRSRIAVQGTLIAAQMALEDGIAANLAGGTHHSFPDHGEGFCVLNDVAVTIKVLQRNRRIDRVLVIDLDVHQGNGTAAIFDGDDSVFTFSMHGEKNYPWNKMTSSLDIDLPDDTDDRTYLAELDQYLPLAFEAARADLIFYLAGVDPVAGDRFGRLSLTRGGLHCRERYVLEVVKRRGVPIVLLLSGGYAATPEATADLHAIVHREAQLVY